MTTSTDMPQGQSLKEALLAQDGALDRYLTEREAFLAALIRRASERAIEGYKGRTAGSYEMKGPQDFLTETDLAVENLIRDEIVAAFPEDAILGEEGGGTPGQATWIIDPIDGTANFARGIPHFCVIVAFCLGAESQLAAIAHPVTGEVYLARRGKGAFKDGAPIAISKTLDADAASIEMGWSRRLPRETYVEGYNYLLEHGVNIRRSGSGGLALCYVAEGRTDGYVEGLMNSWDCVAGLLLVEEAGGRVGNWPATLEDLTKPGPVLAATPALADALVGVGFERLALKPL